MPYLIDGHNLIGHLTDISLDDPNDEALLTQKLNGFAARTGRQCVVVFDYGLPGGPSRMSTRAVQVVFASQRSSADRVMMERIKKIPDPKGWVVVSSDHDVMETAKLRRMQTMTAAQFADLMKSPPRPVVDAGEASDVRLSEAEVDEWLRLFGEDGG
jgi:predicted RNA-binding protein with PIN domain